MQGPTHLMLSWFFADAGGLDDARQRRIVAWAGLAPDIDVLAYIGALVYYRLDQDLAFENVWRVVHHRYTHGLAFVLLTGLLAFWFASGPQRARVALLALAASALHNFFDIVAGGPSWPIYPLWPLDDTAWSASWSYTLADWPNHALLFASLAATLLYAWRAGRSPVEVFGNAAGDWFVAVAQGRNRPAQASSRGGLSVRTRVWLGLTLLALALLLPLGWSLVK